MTIERVNGYASSNAILGWLSGLGYYGWWSASAPSIPLWGWAALVVVGMFAASLIIAGSLAAVAAGVTKLTTGAAKRSLNAYAWAAFLSPVAAFWVSGWTIRAAFR